MNERSKVAHMLGISRHTIARIQKHLGIELYRKGNQYYLTTEDTLRIKRHIKEVEPHLAKKERYNSNDNPLKNQIEAMQDAYLDDPNDMELLREIYLLQFKLKKSTGSKAIECVVVNHANNIR